MADVFPAHAGVIPAAVAVHWSTPGLSRTCGGDPQDMTIDVVIISSFPHMRG